jgi:hypothetical protein
MDGRIHSGSGRSTGQAEVAGRIDGRTILDGVGEKAKPEIEALRAMLEREIDRGLGPQRGCWPLLVGLGGALLGLALLARLL